MKPTSVKTLPSKADAEIKQKHKTRSSFHCKEAEGGIQGIPAFFFYFLITNYFISSDLQSSTKNRHERAMLGRRFMDHLWTRTLPESHGLRYLHILKNPLPFTIP